MNDLNDKIIVEIAKPKSDRDIQWVMRLTWGAVALFLLALIVACIVVALFLSVYLFGDAYWMLFSLVIAVDSAAIVGFIVCRITRREISVAYPLISLAVMAAMVATLFWALASAPPFLIWISRPSWTDADLIRDIWHFRLVQPEWLGSPPNLSRWERAETLARLAVVFLGWLAVTGFINRRYFRRLKP